MAATDTFAFNNSNALYSMWLFSPYWWHGGDTGAGADADVEWILFILSSADIKADAGEGEGEVSAVNSTACIGVWGKAVF